MRELDRVLSARGSEDRTIPSRNVAVEGDITHTNCGKHTPVSSTHHGNAVRGKGARNHIERGDITDDSGELI